jgi:Protein of unknown function (DUF3037)
MHASFAQAQERRKNGVTATGAGLRRMTMTRAKGFFSLIQFCPDLERGESVNVGLVMVVPGSAFFDMRLCEDNQAPKQRFGSQAFDDARLTHAKLAIRQRLLAAQAELTSPEALLGFASREANSMILTAPRVLFTEDPKADLADMFQRLVHVDGHKRQRTAKPNLDEIFASKLIGVPLQKDVTLEVPGIGEVIVPYAYQNGVLNLITSEGFAGSAEARIRKVNELAVRGRLIHNVKSKEHKLAVVAAFADDTTEEERQNAAFIFESHDSRLVRKEGADAFVDEVRRTAHS